MAFTVQSRLGRGRSVETFAAVLEVGKERLDVVVKRARPEYRNNEAFATALESWGNTQKEADHEHLVAVFEAGRTPEGVYVIQEKVDGAALVTLLSMLRRRKRTLKPEFALVVAEQVASALAYLHTQVGVAHGGIDPGEVLLGYDGTVKLGDQRLRELDQHIGKDLVDADDRVDYLAPERHQGEPPSKKSDLYAFALVVLEMLIGHPVWTAESMTVDGTLDALRDFSPVGQAKPDLTKELVDVLGGCLAALPAKRPISAMPVAGALRDLNKRHGITSAGAGLGKFVEALVPPPDAEEAPTQMVDAAFAAELDRKRDEQFEGASVAIDPEIERQAGLPKRAGPLLGVTVELDRLGDRKDTALPKPAEAEPAPKAAPRSLHAIAAAKKPVTPAPAPAAAPAPAPKPAPAPAPKPAAKAPVAPSRKREVSVPQVHRVAAKASSERDADQRRILMFAGIGVAVLLVVVFTMMALSTDERTIRLRATSVPEGAEVYDAEGERLLGRTPLETDVVVDGELMKLRFEMVGHEPHRVTIGSESGEVRYEAKMTAVGAP